MQTSWVFLAGAAALAGCRHGTSAGVPPEPVRPLAAYASQPIVLTPASHVRAADSLGWVKQLGGPTAAARALDTALVTVLGDRGLSGRWILPAALEQSYDRNRSYAADPYQLATNVLRAPALEPGSRYGDPLASQLRTMIALHENARLVLLPVDFHFEPSGAGARGVLHAVLVDPRFTETRWVGDVTSDESASPALAFASVAARLADLFVAP